MWIRVAEGASREARGRLWYLVTAQETDSSGARQE